MVHWGTERWELGGRIGAAAVVVLTAILVVCAAPIQAGALLAQETATVGPDTPSPDECTIEPRRFPLDLATATAGTEAAATPGGDRVTPAPAGPVDADTVDAITDTVRQAIACQNAGDVLREFALYTDAFLARYFASPEAFSEQDIATAFATDPRPVPVEEQLTFVDIRDVRRLEDGRVRAVVISEGAEGEFSDRVTFAREGDRWLIDEFVAVEPAPSGTAEAAADDEATAEP